MRIVIEAGDIEIAPALREYTEQKLRSALGNCTPRVMRVVVRLTNLNGPGNDGSKRCALHIRLRTFEPVEIEVTHASVTGAVDRAAERAARILALRMERLQRRRLKPHPIVAIIATPDFYRL